MLRRDDRHQPFPDEVGSLGVSLNVVSMRVTSDEMRAKGSPDVPPTPVASLEDQEGDRSSYQGMDADEYLQR